ncbi:PIN domain-containing protein [Pseudomonas yamanorum]|uniref:DUF4935 domain-containing protein n=1 Tax=Pseudomonas yamanorum TaxID=515393 RepID=A0A7Y8EDT3_9PSED|nr:PIN domain-containing protein [Pseudomonas yamanorum]NWE12779.1 DUF4935 domain-containing protein [Pseudomonas yamanorum]
MIEEAEKGFTLRSRVLFIDASIYHSNNFQFLTKDLESLTRLLAAGQVTLLLTSITVAEVKRHLREQAKEAASAAQSFQQKGKVLRNIPIFEKSIMFDGVNASEIENQLVEGFYRFLSSENVEILSVDIASADQVFENYFNVRPPFSVKKPNEFRDSFVLETLKVYAIDNNVRIHILSLDKDMEDFCKESPQLIWSNKLGEVVNAVMHSARTLPAAFADQAYSVIKADVFGMVQEFLDEQRFGILDEVENGVQSFSVSIENLRSVNQRVFAADHTFAKYGVDFDIDIIVEYYQLEPVNPMVGLPRDYVDTYKFKKRFVKTVEVALALGFYEGDLESVEIEDWDVHLPNGDILWDYECEETHRTKAFEF